MCKVECKTLKIWLMTEIKHSQNPVLLCSWILLLWQCIAAKNGCLKELSSRPFLVCAERSAPRHLGRVTSQSQKQRRLTHIDSLSRQRAVQVVQFTRLACFWNERVFPQKQRTITQHSTWKGPGVQVEGQQCLTLNRLSQDRFQSSQF